MTKKLDQAVRDLRRVLHKLDGTADRPIARRNARARVLGTLRKIRGAVDTAYPAIVKRGGYTHLTVRGRLQRLLRAGWVIKNSTAAVAVYAGEGVPVRKHPGTSGAMLVPGWANAIGLDDRAKLRAAVKSRKLQLAVLSEAALRTVST